MLELKDGTSFSGERFVAEVDDAEVDDALALIGGDAAGMADVARAYGPSSARAREGPVRDQPTVAQGSIFV